MKLDLLKAAAAAAQDPQDDRLDQGILRFSLEYRAPPDEAAEHARIATLLNGSGFAFYRLPPGDDPNIFILDFKGVERAQSSEYLFEQAHQLADALDLESCTPDVDPVWHDAVEGDHPAPESVRSAVARLCTSTAPAPADPHWAVKAVRADAAWEEFGVRGDGIRIGQPDTGVTDHPELAGAVDLDLGIDVIAGKGPPQDPLSRRMSSPGHGTATSGCVASRPAGVIVGCAPAASVVPIRCINNVVIGSGAAVAAAIDHARRQDCHIVSLSLGGAIEFRDLKRAIRRAVDAGMIVLAAAGNCVRLVVYPAWDENVIAVAGVDAGHKPWKGTSRGGKVDIAAPAEKVLVARRNNPQPADPALVEPGEGTSFATALTAGCAALWLARHTVDAVRSEAAARDVTVQELFRAALRQTAFRPDGWDSAAMGAGVVDAASLLRLPLPAIDPPAAPSASAHPALDALEAGVPWTRFAAEAGQLAFDKALRTDLTRAPALESALAPRPSRALSEALRQAGRSPDAIAAPMILTTPIPPDIPPASALRVITARRPGSAESAGVITEAQARGVLQGGGKRIILDTAQKVLGAPAGGPAPTPGIAALRQQVLGTMPEVLDDFASGVARSARQFKGIKRVAAEALIKLTGRPALRVGDDNFITIDDPRATSWIPDLVPRRGGIRRVIESTGRIDVVLDGTSHHVGTGTVVGPGLVMTNRHVIDAFAEPLPRRGGGHDFTLKGPVTINFAPTGTAPQQSFTVDRVVTAGPDRVGAMADVRKLDMAILAVATTSAGGKPLPEPVDLAPLPGSAGVPGKVLVVGYPAEPIYTAGIDPDTGEQSVEIWDRLWELYGDAYGVKYISPGEVEWGTGRLDGDERAWAFGHDATTLQGNSGSCVLLLAGNGDAVCGLHFGGAPKRVNLAHTLTAVRDIAAGDAGLIDPDVMKSLNWMKG